MKQRYCLLRYLQKTGQVDLCLTGVALGAMKLNALTNTTKTKETVIVDMDFEEIVYTVTGNQTGGHPLVDLVHRSATECGITSEFLADLRRCNK